MKHVLGIGGIFFKAQDPEKLGKWYQEHLGLEVEDYGGVSFREGENAGPVAPVRQSYLVWSPFPADTDYFGPSGKPFMINFRVADLDKLLTKLRAEGVTVEEKTDRSELVISGGRWIPKGTESSFGSLRSRSREWAVRVSNPRPTGCKPAALPLS
jgi:catechol 2,3-dioxygenase-like lactoylglutathione lyase family enzyme